MGYYIVPDEPEAVAAGIKQHWATYREAWQALRRERDGVFLKRVQQEKLHLLLQEAYTHIPFYHRMLEERGLYPEDIQSVDDLAQLPLLTRLDLQSHFSELLSLRKNFGRIVRNRTSGSTGQPVTSLFEWDIHQSVLSISKIRQQKAWGIRGHERILYVVPRRFHFAGNIYPQRMIDLNGLHTIWQVHPTEEDHDWVQLLNDVKPTIIYGNPYLMHHLIECLKKSGSSFYLPKLLLSSFELLDRPSRAKMSTFFQADICDIYGLSEVGDVAWECPTHGGHHINSDYVIVEILQKGRPVFGTEGEIVVTSLSNFVMPMIRYCTGDVATLVSEPCECGRHTPRLVGIKGRNVDFITLSNGCKISPYDLMDILNITGVSRFQIIQIASNHLTVKISDEVTQELVEMLRHRLEHKLGSDVHIHIERMEAVENPLSDKLRVVSSQMRGNEQL